MKNRTLLGVICIVLAITVIFGISPRTYQDIFKRHLKQASISDANFHSLRHTFATRAIEQGMDILVLSKILGHAQPSTTLNKYGYVFPDHKKENMNKMSELYNTRTNNELVDSKEDVISNMIMSF